MDNIENFWAAWRNLTYAQAVEVAGKMCEDWQLADGDVYNHYDFARMMHSCTAKEDPS